MLHSSEFAHRRPLGVTCATLMALATAACEPNLAPVAGDPIPRILVSVGNSAVLDLAEHFTSPIRTATL